MKTNLTTTSRFNEPTSQGRGQEYGGGRYVGCTKHTVWIAYPGDDFDAMCKAFDRLYF
jgi:hypothetical protein